MPSVKENLVPFTLTLLGTDTIFTPHLKGEKGPRVKDYPKGETLSVVSSHIVLNGEPPIIPDNPKGDPIAYAYISREVEIINGPTTLGTEVGDRIGKGVASVLKAIARGQNPININAHSRGAVEGIIVAHELDALQKLIVNADNLQNLLKALEEQQTKRKSTSSTPDIFAALKGQLKDQLTGTPDAQKAFFDQLKANFPQTKVNLFAIDPVPGDVRPITWYDPRFGQLPAIINEAEFLYYENERSDWGFTPLYAEPFNPQQKVRYLSIPGHHGTGSAGDNKSQQKVNVSPAGKKTTDVQKLIMFKLINFLGRHGVQFNTERMYAKGRALGGRSVRNKIDYTSTLRKLYGDLVHHRDAYRAYNKTSYKMMGVLKDDRRLLRQGKYTKFQDRFNTNSGYINEEHAEIMQAYFFEKLGVNNIESDSLKALVQRANTVLVEKISEVIAPKGIAAQAISLAASMMGTKAPLLSQSQVRNDIVNAFEVLVQKFSGKFLSNEWHTEEQLTEKKELYHAIVNMIAQLKELAVDDPENPQKPEGIIRFIDQLLNKTSKGIQDTVEQQNLRLQSEVDRFFIDPIQHYVNRQVLKITGKEKIDVEVQRIFLSTEYRNLANATANDKLSFLWNKLVVLYPGKIQSLSLELFLTQYDEFQKIYKDELADYNVVQTRIGHFLNDLNALALLYPELAKHYAAMRLQLQTKANTLIQLAANRFYNKNSVIDPKKVAQTDFEGNVIRFAIEEQIVEDPIAALEKLNKELGSKKESDYLKLKRNLTAHTETYFKVLENLKDLDADEQEITNEKIAHLKKLMSILKKDHSKELPSKIVNQFYVQLNDSEISLGKHRDAEWKRYVRNAVLIGFALITGILPALIALLIYVSVGETEHKSFLFWRTRGENLVNYFKDIQILESQKIVEEHEARKLENAAPEAQDLEPSEPNELDTPRSQSSASSEGRDPDSSASDSSDDDDDSVDPILSSRPR